MNVNNLKEGQTIKNYKELCEILDIKATTGNSKKSQLKELELYCNYIKDGNKYIIQEIYNEPIQQLGIGLYKEDIELLILDLLARNKESNYFVSLTIKNLLRALEMVNNNFVEVYNYKEPKKQFNKLNEVIKVDTAIIGDIFYLVKDKTKRNIVSALKDLADKSLILWELRIKVCRIEIELELNSSGNIKLDEQGNAIIKEYNEFYDYATQEEKNLILKTEKEVMESMNIKKKTYFNINKDARMIFVKEVNRRLKQENIKFYYYTYDITYNKDDVLKELNRVELAEVRNRLNKNVLEQVLKTIEYLSNKTKDKYKAGFGELPPEATDTERIRYNKNYTKDGNKTAKAIVDRKTKVRI